MTGKIKSTNHSHLWNSLSKEERFRLMPFEIETQIRHIQSCKEKAISHHKAHLSELNGWIKNLEAEMRKMVKSQHHD